MDSMRQAVQAAKQNMYQMMADRGWHYDECRYGFTDGERFLPYEEVADFFNGP